MGNCDTKDSTAQVAQQQTQAQAQATFVAPLGTANPTATTNTQLIVAGIPIPPLGTFDQRLVDWILNPLHDDTPSKNKLLQVIKKLDIPAEQNNIKDISTALINLSFDQDSPEKKIKIFDAILSFTEDAADSAEDNTIDPNTKQAHIFALLMKGQILGYEMNSYSQGKDLLQASLELQMKYNPGKDGRFLLLFFPMITAMMSKMKDPAIFKKGVEHFHRLSDIFLSPSGGAYEDVNERDAAVPQMMRVDPGNIQSVAYGLNEVVFGFQDHLALYSGEEIQNMLETCLQCIDKMRKCFTKIEIDIDDATEILNNFGVDELDGAAINPLKSSCNIVLLCIDSMMSLKGEFRDLRQHCPEVTRTVACAAFGAYSQEALIAATSSIFSVLCAGPAILIKPFVQEIRTVCAGNLGFDFFDIANINNGSQVADESRWGSQAGYSLLVTIEAMLVLWKEGNADAKQVMKEIYACSSVLLSTDRAIRDLKSSHRRQLKFFKALSGMYLKEQGAAAYFESTVTEGIQFFESGRLASDSDFSFVDRAAYLTNLARAWSFREHWTAISLALNEDGTPVTLQKQHGVMINLIDNAIKFLDEGAAKKENRNDVLSYEFAYAALADGLERTGTILLSHTYSAFEKAIAAALKRGNVFAAASYMRNKAVLMRKFDQANEAAEAEINRGLDLIIDVVVNYKKSDRALPNQRLRLANDCFEILVAFEPKWFANAVAAKCDAAIEKLESSETTCDVFLPHCKAMLYFAAGSSLHRVGVSKKPAGWMRIKKGLLYFSENGEIDQSTFDRAVEKGNGLLDRLVEVVGVEREKIVETMNKWANQASS